MQHQNRITYRFDRNGNKIDSSQQQDQIASEVDSTQELNIEQLEQLIRNSDGVIADTGELRASLNEGRLSTDEQKQYKHIDLDNYDLEASRSLYDAYQPDWTAPTSHEGAHQSEWAASTLQEGAHQPERAASTLHEKLHQPDWTAPTLYDEQLLHEVQVSRRKGKFSWTNGLVAVLCAVLTGTLLGYLLLVQVFGSVHWPNSKSTESTVIGDAAVDQAEVLPSTVDNVPTVSLNMSEVQYNYQLLQAGVFSKEDTRDEVISALQKAGYAAQYTQVNNGKYFVYAAIATSLNNIEPFKTAVSGFELYRKELVLQLPKKVQYDGEAKQLESYVQSSNQLIGMYADLVAAQLEQPTLSVIGSSAQQASQTQYDKWEIIAQETMGGFKGTANESQATQLQQSLQLAHQQLLKYQEKPSAKNIWGVEAAIIKAVLVQKEWFE
ncbi:MAG TPA: hypothetical protein IAA29_20665 [Candidatus Paenibacillus intestinavium]|nr:hypothetical protein [Candidatus Paenibacillus intestinavium]